MRNVEFSFFIGCVTAAVVVAQHENLVCTKEGRFADEDDCGSFIECIINNEGFLTSQKRSCHGRAFDPVTATCTEPSQVKGCYIRRSRHLVYSASKFDHLCKNPDVHFACGNCGTQVTCIQGKAFETKCDKPLTCNANISDFEGAVCHLQHDERCSCSESNSYYEDPYANEGFFFCKHEDSYPKLYTCPSSMKFDKNIKMCLNEDGVPACTKKGFFVYPNTCSRYYACTYALEGWVQTRLTCETGKLFNEATMQCEDPCDWALKKFSCTVQGRFGDPENCNSFFECIDDGQGSFIQMNRTCPPYYHWNADLNRCTSHHSHICQVKKEGPIDQCLGEYKKICVLEGMNQPSSALDSDSFNQGNSDANNQSVQTGEGESPTLSSLPDESSSTSSFVSTESVTEDETTRTDSQDVLRNSAIPNEIEENNIPVILQVQPDPSRN